MDLCRKGSGRDGWLTIGVAGDPCSFGAKARDFMSLDEGDGKSYHSKKVLV